MMRMEKIQANTVMGRYKRIAFFVPEGTFTLNESFELNGEWWIVSNYLDDVTTDETIESLTMEGN